MNSNLRRYLGYAAGEIVLVIVGILIALQIDGWNDDRQTERELKAQLQGVSENIREDLDAITQLKKHRNESIMNATRLSYMTGPAAYAENWYSADYVEVASSLISERQTPVYFVAATGAYEALEASGNATHIRNERMKRDLHGYYATVERIVTAEREMNGILRDLILKYQTETVSRLPRYILEEPLIAWLPSATMEPEQAQRLRDLYLELVTSPVTEALIRADINQPLLKEYERLISLGSSLIAQIDAYGEGIGTTSVESTPQGESGTGPAIVFRDGVIQSHAFGLFTAPVTSSFPTRMDDIALDDEALRINYNGDNDWQFVYALVGPIAISTRRHFLDFSRFDRIRLELRHHSGCDNLRLVLKDAEDPDDGSQVNIRLELTDDWSSHDYELSRFSDADLTILNVAAGFLMDASPCDFSIRDVVFLSPGEA